MENGWMFFMREILKHGGLERACENLKLRGKKNLIFAASLKGDIRSKISTWCFHINVS